jgi:O-antigen/teichoic acid export membrane protein
LNFFRPYHTALAVPPRSLRAKVVAGLFWLAATKASGQAISWVITLVVVRLLAPQDYGLMGLTLLSTRFLLLFNELGLGAAVVQRPNLTAQQLSNVAATILAVNVAFFGVMVVLAPPIAAYFNEPALVPLIRTMGVVFVLNGIGCAPGFLLQRQMAFRKKAAAEIVGLVAGGIATLVLAAAGVGVWSLVFGHLVTQGLTNLLYYVYAPIRYTRHFSARSVLDLLDFGIRVAVARLLWWVSTSADAVVVGRLLGTTALGYYGLAAQFAAIPLDKIVSLVTQVALPSFAAVQHDDATTRRHYLKLVGSIALVTFPMFAGIALLAEGGVQLALGDTWAPIVVPMQILCVVSCLRGVETMNAPVLLAKNRPGIPLFNGVIQAVVLPIAFVAGTPWGVSGVAGAWLLAWPMLFGIVTWQTCRVIQLRPAAYLEALRHPVVGTGTMALIVALVRRIVAADGASVVDLVLLAIAGALTYLAYQATFNRAAMADVAGSIRLRGRNGAPMAPDARAAVAVQERA